MSTDNEDHVVYIFLGALSFGVFLLCVGATINLSIYYLNRKATKLRKKSIRAERFVQDLEAQTQPQAQTHEQATQPPPHPHGDDFSGFDFSSIPFCGTEIPPPPTVPNAAGKSVHQPNGHPPMQRRQTIDGAMETPILRRKSAFTNTTRGEGSPRPPLAHPDEFELEDVDLHSS
ncbi:hypothetical protein F4814DRAFT_448469 [Daldinia grandis]|nr:hypothetical protein F4814DRAFT_448469 [Daldinia grandis]